MQTSKLILFSTTIIFCVISGIGITCNILSCSTDIFTYLIPVIGGVWGATIIFYLKKAQLENSIKIQLGMIEDILKLKKDYNYHNDEELLQEEANSYLDQYTDATMDKLNGCVTQLVDEALEPIELQTYN